MLTNPDGLTGVNSSSNCKYGNFSERVKDEVPGLTCNLIGKNHSRGAVKHLGFESDDCSIHGRIKRCS